MDFFGFHYIKVIPIDKVCNWLYGKAVCDLRSWPGARGTTACMWIQVCIGHKGVYRGHYRDVKGRLFLRYNSYLVLLKYMIG